MKLTTILTALAVSGILCGPATSATAGEENKEAGGNAAKLAAQARIGKAEAEKIALARVPNSKIKEAELEEEDGALVWSFDLTKPGAKDVTEVLVDAKTGKVVSVDKESPEAELKEKRVGHKEKKEQGSEERDEDKD